MTQFLSHNKPCARCPRVESREITLEEASKLYAEDKARAGKPVVAALLTDANGEDKTFRFDYLCNNCRGIVAEYLNAAFRQLTKQSSVRASEEE